MASPNKIKISAGMDVRTDVVACNSEPDASIISHAVLDTISESGISSTHCIETGISCPTQVTIEVEEKPLYDVQESHDGQTYSEIQPPCSDYTENPDTDQVPTSGKRKLELCKVQVVKKVKMNKGRKTTTVAKATSQSKEEEISICACFFCKVPLEFDLKVMHIVLDKPLPMSSLDPLSLLHCFGMDFPGSRKINKTGFMPVDLCGKCYIVISECDELYPYLRSAIAKVLEVWPEKMNGMKTLSLNVMLEDQTGRGKSKQKNSYSKTKSKLPKPDVQLSFSYATAVEFAARPSGKSENGSVVTFEETNRAGQKSCLNDIFTCGFCGVPLSSKENWKHHIRNVHRIAQAWHSYYLQTALKYRLSQELSTKVTRGGDRERKAQKLRCHACNGSYQTKSELLTHLLEYHDIIIDTNKMHVTDSKANSVPLLKCKEEQRDSEDDQRSPAFSDGNESGDNVADSTDIKVEAVAGEGAKSSVKKISETNVKKVYAPHWRCRICGMLFSSHAVVMKHRRQAHPDSTRIIKKKLYDDYDENVPDVKKELRCPVCNQCVEDREALKEHLHVIHQKYMVVLSKNSAPEKENLAERVRGILRKTRGVKSRNQQPIKGDLGYCVVLKGDGQGGIDDQRLSIDDELDECFDSDSTQTSSAMPKSHSTEEKDKQVTCGICREKFANRILLAEHSCSVKEEGNVSESKENVGGNNEIVMLECKLCDRRLQGVHALRIHMSRAHRDPNRKRQYKHRCKIPVCNFQTQLRSQFYKHMKEKHSIDVQPPVKCFICGKMYNSHYLSRHIAVVHGTNSNKKYACKFCDMKYHDLVYLKRHVYFDHANKKWKCQVCQMEFEKYHQLRQHRVNVHSTHIIKCPDCLKTFKRMGDLTTHRKRVHEKKVPAACSFCSKTYCEPSKLRAHLIEKHGVPWENTLSVRYARHQQENNCLRRPAVKEGKFLSASANPDEFAHHEQAQDFPGESGIHRSKSAYGQEESEARYHRAEQQEYMEGASGSHHYGEGEIVVSKRDIINDYESAPVNDTQQSEYSVVDVTASSDNMNNLGEISYIIYEESNTTEAEAIQ